MSCDVESIMLKTILNQAYQNKTAFNRFDECGDVNHTLYLRCIYRAVTSA